MNNENLESRKIQDCISNISDHFKRTPHTFLTEDDLRFHLCRNLFAHFGTEEETQDGSYSIPLHSEVRWYGNKDLNGKHLNIRSDIVLIDVSSLNVLTPAKLPTKGFGFNVPKAIIELKLRRPQIDSDSHFLKKINEDISKLMKLKKIFDAAQRSKDVSYWMVILDKKGDIKNDLPTCEEINLHYTTIAPCESTKPTTPATGHPS